MLTAPTTWIRKPFARSATKTTIGCIDRQAQRTQNFTGIVGVNTQDRAVQELQGRIADRTKEHLGPADKAIITARQVLLQAVKAVQAGDDPPATDTSYYRARSAVKIMPAKASWREAHASGDVPGRCRLLKRVKTVPASTKLSTNGKSFIFFNPSSVHPEPRRRCAQSPRSGWPIAYGLWRMVPWFHLYAISDQPYAISDARLASEIFLSSLQTVSSVSRTNGHRGAKA